MSGQLGVLDTFTAGDQFNGRFVECYQGTPPGQFPIGSIIVEGELATVVLDYSGSALSFDVDFEGNLTGFEGATGPLEGVVWLEQQRAGPWLQRTLGGPDGLKFDLIQTVDIDGDGDLDVFTCEERDQLGVFWYENRLQHGSK